MKVGYFSGSLCVINKDFSFSYVSAELKRDQILQLIFKLIELVLISEFVCHKEVSNHLLFVCLTVVLTLKDGENLLDRSDIDHIFVLHILFLWLENAYNETF